MRKAIITKRLSSLVSSGLFAGLLFVCAISGLAQKTRNTDYNPDKSLKSNARINPSTLAMELSVPLGGAPGRAGNAMPITFDYSSKVWQFKSYVPYPVYGGTITEIEAKFAKRTAAGWTSSLGVPRIDYPNEIYRGNDPAVIYEGQIQGDPTQTDPNGYALYYIKRLHVNLPDGSSHEFRASDQPIVCGYLNSGGGCGALDFTGIYLSVDGSKMRLEVGSSASTLYMPDGSRYLFGARQSGSTGSLATAYIDPSGNQITYNGTSKQWTDTMGRAFENLLPLNAEDSQDQIAGLQTIYLPGLGVSREAKLTWEYLKNPNTGASALTDPNQNLGYVSDTYCWSGSGTAINGTALFNSTSEVGLKVCNYGTSAPGNVFNPVVLTEIKLPDNSKYQFKYNLRGEIEKVIYPTGAYERFAYSYFDPVQVSKPAYDQANRGVADRWVSATGNVADEVHWHYSVSLAPYTVTVTAPDGTSTKQLLHDEQNTSVERPYGFDNAKTGRSYEDRAYSSGGSPQLLRRHLTDYTSTENAVTTGISATRDIRPLREISIIFEPGSSYALAQMSETIYDTGGSGDAQYFSALNPKQSKTYHYAVLSVSDAQPTALSADNEFNRVAALLSGASLAATSETNYLYDANYKARNINGLAIETRIKDASGAVKATTQIGYDDAGYTLNSTGAMPAAAANSWLNPQTELGITVGSKRGLPTTVRSYSDVSAGQSVVTHSFYDQYGNLRKTQDAKGNESTVEYDYTNAFAYPTKSTSPIPGNGTNGSNAAFVTTSIFDYNTGLPTSVTDANGLETRMEYVDALLRPTKTSNYYANQLVGSQTTTEYGAGTSDATRFVHVSTQIDATNWKQAYSGYDGLGRTVRTQSLDSSGDVFSDTQYDTMGRVKKVTNPYRRGETVYWTESFYDDLGRVTKIKTPDNAEVNTAYSLATTGGEIGTVVTVTDQASKQRRSVTNALGQLRRVDEPDNSNSLGTINAPAQPTLYNYDPLGNLSIVTQTGTTAAQCGGPVPPNCTQTRSFLYDSLSRLKTATNPESGAINYTYDNNGNLQTRMDARNVTTTYGYDNLNRVVSRTYSNEPAGQNPTPAVSYFYDNLANAKGRLIKVFSTVSTTEYTGFDTMGRVTSHQQTTDGTTYTTGYGYNLSGGLLTETYPSTRVVQNVLDGDGDLALVQSKKTSAAGFWNYAKSFTYTAAGAVSSMQLGNGKWESTAFNSRLQPTQIALGTVQNGTDNLKLNFSYNSSSSTTDNNGNVISQTITVPAIGTNAAFTATQNYTYDSLNRLKQAVETIPGQTGWQQTYTYDRFGNRNFDEANTTTLTKNCSSGTTVCAGDVPVYDPVVSATTNRLNGYGYDNAGNTTSNASSQTFTYDAENKQTKVQSGSTVIGEYSYDGDGKRVKKNVPATGETTIFVYDAIGKMVAEYSTIVEPASTAKVSYLTSDHLGSPRITTDANGGVTSRRDFLPFGEEITASGSRAGYGSDSVRQKFTSYERDIESELDYAEARYYNSKHGRFTSVDPLMASAIDIQPQSWNRYAYVGNNPLNLTDSSGMKSDECPAGKVCTLDKDGKITNIADDTNPITILTTAIGAIATETVTKTTYTYEWTINFAKQLPNPEPLIEETPFAVGKFFSVPLSVLTLTQTMGPSPCPDGGNEVGCGTRMSNEKPSDSDVDDSANPNPDDNAPTASAKKGGGKTGKKINENRKKASQERERNHRDEKERLEREPRTPKSIARIKELKKLIKHEQLKQQKSETHWN